MTISLVEKQLKLKYKPNDPPSYQLHDLFEDYFPRHIEQHLRELNTTYPLVGLEAQIAGGEITYGQWLLYTSVCFSGQVANGGVEQFLENCPGLVGDAATILDKYASPDFNTAYRDAVRPLLDLISNWQLAGQTRSGEDLSGFWEAFEVSLDQVDTDATAKIEAACYSSDRDTDPKNWFHEVETRVVRYVLDHPEEYRKIP